MRLATLRSDAGTFAARIADDGAVHDLGIGDVGQLLALPGWESIAQGGRRRHVAVLDYAPVVPRPGKIVCVGLNYRHHITEMGREIPEYPTLFAKFPEALVGAGDDIVAPAASAQLDWEAELAVVIGRRVRHADRGAAVAAIAGYSVLNDVTVRDYQYRTPEWLQGKTFEATTPFGPTLVTPDEFDPATAWLSGWVDGEQVQSATPGDLVFDAAALIEYISAILTLAPGDVIATGTPGGVGHARTPRRYLSPGAVLRTSVSGLGELRNPVVAETITGAVPVGSGADHD
ncbi:fumarylacetoacetate hydrolase family protein [Nocardia mexicana]|uniref:Acylpyruvate hydrolase n=1 Tax=Nocardia mexicana TaxID=279262 RepID=A0A370HFD2_9NOCA|nr:fumarylacetoacetate hydrolase family protein [Nocardia mexicana]RDI55941.1 acylpyruvate hydrolase [Nocardia mexicana]